MYLEIENLSVDLGEFHLKNISLSLKKGDYLALIGPTGSGKSVLLETIIGFYNPEFGTIKLNNKIINHILPEKREIGIVYQDHILFPNMNVYDNIAYGARNKFSSEEIEEKIAEIAKIMKIESILHRDINTLSGGESQRAALARALIVEPKILLMDEPFSALDVTTQSKLTTLIKEIGKTYKTTFLHVTHNFNDVWNLANKVGVMKDGEIHQLDNIKEVFSRPENNFVAEFVGIDNIIEGNIIKFNSQSAKVQIKNNIIIHSSDPQYLNILNEKKKQENYKNNDNLLKVLIAIRPENIVFSNQKFESSAKNQLKGKISEIIESGPHVWVKIDVNNCIFKGLLTKSSAENLELKKSKEIYISFKSLNVNMLKQSENFSK